MKTIAIITGASSGMGKRFAETLPQSGVQFDEAWVIARRLDRLEALRLPCSVRPLQLDLTCRDSFQQYAALLAEERPNVALLVNCSGYGKFGAALDTPLADNLNMVDLNCEALMALCQLTVPYMQPGGRILNVASVAAFQPIPYIAVYGATKAFVLSYSRALHRELRGAGLTVTAVCPFWTRTEFFNRAITPGREAVVKHYLVMYDPDQIVSRAWRDARRGRDMSTFGFVARAQGLLVKLLPHRLVMWLWMQMQRLR